MIISRGKVPDPEELRGFARTWLAGFKTPGRLVVGQEIPRTSCGKILERRLRAGLNPSG